MFNSLNEVPAQIREFYVEEVRQEPTGNFIDVEYTYQDESGKDQVGTTQEPEYADVTCVVLKPFGEIQHRVETLLANNADLALVEQFIDFENNGIDKQYHDDFLAWYQTEPEDAELQQTWQTLEPVRPKHKVLEDYPEHKSYLKLRGIEFDGVMCSATKEDFWGLSAAEDWIRAGNASMWEFSNGSKLELNKDNIDAFYAVWVPFRLSFFDIVK